jgi:hypothetical protein
MHKMFIMRKYIVLLTFFLGFVVINSTYSQQQLNHEKKMYKSPEGKLYVQKSMPIYVRIATSPKDEAESYLLKSEVTHKYSNPMYFDVEGYNTFRSPSQVDTVTKIAVVPKTDIIYEVYADNTPPVSKIKFDVSNTRQIKDKIFVKGKTGITLSADDALSGTENIYFSIDGAGYQIYNTPIPLDLEKEYILKYYSVDNVGNVESAKTAVIVIDLSSPKTSFIIKGSYWENILAGNATISFSAVDNSSGVSQIRYRLNSGAEKQYNTPITATYLEQGEHKIVYYAVDQVANNEPENVFDFYVDKTPPTLIQEITGKSFVANGKEFSSGRSQLKITALDNKAGIKEIYYSINNGKYKLYDKPVTLANISGNLTVKSYAVDNVGNIGYFNDAENNQRRNISYVDLTGPVLSYGFSGPVFYYNNTPYISNNTKIILKGTDNESGFSHIEYTLNDSEYMPYKQPFIVEKQGSNTIAFTGYDNIDNTNNNSFSFMVDTTGPVISCVFSVKPVNLTDGKTYLQDVYPRHCVIFVSATDNITGFDRMYYSFNGLPEKMFTGYISTIPVNENNTLTIKAFDKLGNVSVKTFQFGIETSSR